jgi:hypothetical protein
MDSYPFIESIKIFQNSYHTKIGHETINLKILDYVVDGNKYINLVTYKDF